MRFLSQNRSHVLFILIGSRVFVKRELFLLKPVAKNILNLSQLEDVLDALGPPLYPPPNRDPSPPTPMDPSPTAPMYPLPLTPFDASPPPELDIRRGSNASSRRRSSASSSSSYNSGPERDDVTDPKFSKLKISVDELEAPPSRLRARLSLNLEDVLSPGTPRAFDIPYT